MAAMGSWGFLTIACLLTVAVLYWVALVIMHDKGLRVATAQRLRGRMTDCRTCAGQGDLALLWDEQAQATTWQPTTGKDGHALTGVGRMNTKSCPDCAGLGNRWVDD